ncbi:hypothetical protein [Streptomyces sp. NPDC051109]|uniref:hypothetical protein n=1 Tax=Streptomyces sp. NPDC051109 TaxID=3365642 RepID=UPI00378AED7E
MRRRKPSRRSGPRRARCLGPAPAGLACLLAGAAEAALWWPGGAGPRRAAAAAGRPPLRRLHPVPVGDYLAWLAVGAAAMLPELASRP